MDDKKNKTFSTAKIAINIVVTILVMAGLVLTSFFVLNDFNINLAGKEFWTQKIILAILTFLIMLSVANVTEEKLKKGDTEYTEKLNNLSTQFTATLANGNKDNLMLLIELKNKKKKYEQYIRKNKTLLQFFKKDKQKLKYYKRLVKTPIEVWETPNAAKYNKIVYGQLVSGIADVSKKDDENDLSVHKLALAVKKAFYKIMLVITIGGFAADLAYGYVDFNKTMIVPLIFKILSALVAVYAGISFGYIVIDKSKIVLKKKLSIYSELNSFLDENGKLKENTKIEIPITIDTDIAIMQSEIERIEAEISKEKATRPTKTKFKRIIDKLIKYKKLCDEPNNQPVITILEAFQHPSTLE